MNFEADGINKNHWADIFKFGTVHLNLLVNCSDEGLTLETSAKHHIPQATNIPYQPC